jgi:protein CpxP
MSYTMSKVTLLSIAIAGLIAVNLGLMAFLFFRKPPMEGPERPGMGMHPDGPKKIIIERLHFDPQQVAQYEQLIEQHRSAIRKLDQDIRDTKNNLYATLPDSLHAGRDSLQNRLGSLQREIETVHYQHFEAIRQLCHPDQLAYFTDLTHDLARYFAPGKNGPPPPKDR